MMSIVLLTFECIFTAVKTVTREQMNVFWVYMPFN